MRSRSSSNASSASSSSEPATIENSQIFVKLLNGESMLSHHLRQYRRLTLIYSHILDPAIQHYPLHSPSPGLTPPLPPSSVIPPAACRTPFNIPVFTIGLATAKRYHRRYASHSRRRSEEDPVYLQGLQRSSAAHCWRLFFLPGPILR